jgi:hypothetical protein
MYFAVIGTSTRKCGMKTTQTCNYRFRKEVTSADGP